MQKNSRKNIFLGAIISLFITNSFAATAKMQDASNAVSGLDKTIAEVKKASPLPVLFPTKIPVSDKTPKLYSSYSSYFTNPDFKKYWTINVDASSDCNGAHYCNIGALAAEKDGKLESSYEAAPKIKRMKQIIKLQNGSTAYFTPGHAEADFHSTMIEWQSKDVLYKLTWNIRSGDEKAIITKMANSALFK
jgi:hypothetical protein